MPPGDLWLHPMHTTANADGIPFVPVGMQRKFADAQALHSFVSELAHTSHGAAASSGHDVVESISSIWRVCLSRSGMMITPAGETRMRSQPSIPLLFCELVHASAGRQQLIAIGRRDNIIEVGQSKKKDRHSCIGPFEEVWVLFVDGDQDVLHSVLGAMSALGAIRADFNSVYQLCDRPIGAGSCSAVHLGKRLRPGIKKDLSQTILDETLHQHQPEVIAVKIFKLRPDHHDSEMLTAELAHLLALHTHPNIVSYYGAFIAPAVDVGAPMCWIMALGWCSRGDLHDYLMRVGSCKEMHAAELLVGLLAALSHMHSCCIVHRDVKVENVLLGEDGRPMLADFGFATRVDDDQAMMRRCGSPGYVAPEILNGLKYGCKVDVFSAGCVLYFLLYSTLPFAGPDVLHILRRTKIGKINFPKASGRVSHNMKEAVLHLLQHKQESRIDSKSALCLMWSGWCRDRCLPQWLCNREREFSGGSPCDSATSPNIEAVAYNSRSSSKYSSMDLAAGVATAVVKVDPKERSEVAPFEIACKKVEKIKQDCSGISSDMDQQAHQSRYSRGTDAAAGTTQTSGSPWHSDRIPRRSGSSADLSVLDLLFPEDISESPQREEQNEQTIVESKHLSDTCNQFQRSMWASPKMCMFDKVNPPTAAGAEAGRIVHSSQQVCAPVVPKNIRMRWYPFSKRALSAHGCQQSELRAKQDCSSIISDTGRQVHQIRYSRGIDAAAGTTQTSTGYLQSDCTPGTSGISPDFSVVDLMLSEDISESPQRKARNEHTIVELKKMSDTCNQNQSSMGASSKMCMLDAVDPPTSAVAEAVRFVHLSQQVCAPEAPKNTRMRRYPFSKRALSTHGCQQSEHHVKQDCSSISSGTGRQVHQSRYSRGADAAAGTTQTSTNSLYSDGTPGTSGSPPDFSVVDLMLSEDISESPQRNSRSQKIGVEFKHPSDMCNHFWRRMRTSPKTSMIDQVVPPATAVAEAARIVHSSQQVCEPQAPGNIRMRRYPFTRRALTRHAWQQSECQMGGVGQENAGMHDEQQITHREGMLDNVLFSTNGSMERATTSASSGWCFEASVAGEDASRE